MVELVAKTVPTIDGVGTEDFSAWIARIGKIKDNPERLIKYLLKHSHVSPFEHTYFTMKIVTSRCVGRELLRHRSFTFQEKSLRYEPALGFENIELRKQCEDNRQSSTDILVTLFPGGSIKLTTKDESIVNWIEKSRNLLVDILHHYNSGLELGIARECARMILPEATSTTILMTGNIRSWIHFLAIRDDERAQKEMQLLAKEISALLAIQVPLIFKKEE